MSQTISDLIEQLEIPREYVDAMFKAYELGADMGFFRALEATGVTTAASPDVKPTGTSQNAPTEELRS